MLLCLFSYRIYINSYICWTCKQLREVSKLKRNTSNVRYNILPIIKSNLHCSHSFKMNRSFEKFINHGRLFHSSPKSSDIPEYLKEIASKVPQLEEEILEEMEELENSMEEEIIEFLLSRAILYEELEGSFIVVCPSCGHSDKTHDMFIDKNSGYCVCPWCCWDGCWADLVKLFDAREDSLTHQQLENYFLGVKPIDDSHLSLLTASPLMDIEIEHLKAIEAGITEDHSQIVFPLKGENNEKVGFASMSLLHPKPEVVKRVLEGESAIFCALPLPTTKKILKRIIIVSHIFDAFHLAKFKMYGAVLVADPKPKTLSWAFKGFKTVVIWMQFSKIPQSLLLYLSLKCINSCAVKLTVDQSPITSMSENKISGLISDSMPILSDAIITFHDIKNKIYDRIIHKDEMFGIKWTRFKELNELLLGHREGEVTVFSGQTGSGKTTFMSEYSLDLCMQGVCTLWGSFEVNVTRLCEIMMRQFSGKALPEDYSEFEALANRFSELPMHFLNSHGQHPIKDIINKMTEAVLIKGVRHVIIDNLQFMLGLHGANADWWLEQDRAVGAFRQFATAYNCHVTLIVHPRKLTHGEKLNLHSICGGARVTQEADNVMILHMKENKNGTSSNSAPKTIQVAKNRYGGTLGEMKVKFHKESLTLSSCFRKTKNGPQSPVEDLRKIMGLPS